MHLKIDNAIFCTPEINLPYTILLIYKFNLPYPALQKILNQGKTNKQRSCLIKLKTAMESSHIGLNIFLIDLYALHY